jgi:hypothetical protein
MLSLAWPLVLVAAVGVGGCGQVKITAVVDPAPSRAAREPDVYLPPRVTGADGCYNPDSALLRRHVQAAVPASGARLDSAQLADDVRTLHRMLRRNYAGYSELAQHRSFDAEAFFARWEAVVRASQTTVSFADGVERPLLELWRALTDLHFGIPAVKRRHPELLFTEYQREVPEDFQAGRCQVAEGASGEGAQVAAHTLRVVPLLRADGRRARLLTVSAQGAARTVTVRCGGEVVELGARLPPAAASSPAAAPAEAPIYSFRSLGDTGVITLRRLHGTAAELAQLQAFVRDYPLHRRHAHLIFDLRGNGGGNDGYVYDWIRQARTGIFEDPVSVTLHGPLLPCLKWNWRVLAQLQEGTVDSAAARAERERLQRGWPLRSHPTFRTASRGVDEGRSTQPYRGRIVVLVDRVTGSSGESSADMLRRAMGAQLVGERTAGLMEFGNVVRFYLPRTGIPWSFATKRNHYEQPLEGVGLAVDLYLEDPAVSPDRLRTRLR